MLDYKHAVCQDSLCLVEIPSVDASLSDPVPPSSPLLFSSSNHLFLSFPRFLFCGSPSPSPSSSSSFRSNTAYVLSRPLSYFLSLDLSLSLYQPVVSALSSPLLEYLRLEISYIPRVRFTSDNSTINTIGRELATIASRLERPSSLGFRRIRFKNSF